MDTSAKHDRLPPDLPLTTTSFYTVGSSVTNIRTGLHAEYEYVVFDYDSQCADFSHTETIVAMKTESPKIPDTNLSRASGLKFERVGGWIFAFETDRIYNGRTIDGLVKDIVDLLEYAKGFPQNV